MAVTWVQKRQFSGGNNAYSKEEPEVSIGKTGKVTLNAKALETIGSPSHIIVGTDDKAGTIHIKGAKNGEGWLLSKHPDSAHVFTASTDAALKDYLGKEAKYKRFQNPAVSSGEIIIWMNR